MSGDRISKGDVDQAFKLLCDEARRNGLDTSTWELHNVDASYSLYERDSGGRVEHLCFTENFGAIGKTRREAYTWLYQVRLGMYAIRYHRTRKEDNS